MREKNNVCVVEAVTDNVPRAVSFAQKYLSENRVDPKERARALLVCEEVIYTMSQHADAGSEISVTGKSFFGTTKLLIRSRGGEFDLDQIVSHLLVMDTEELGEDEQNVMKQMVGRLFSDSFSMAHKRGVTYATIQVRQSSYIGLIYTLAALILGVAAGLILQTAAPAEVSSFLARNVFTPVFTLFMNVLKMILAPLVFFSVASSIADFSDLHSLGRIAVKMVTFYLITSMIAIGVGMLTYNIFPIGDPALASAVMEEAAQDSVSGETLSSVSVKETLIGIVPDNIISPFMESNMLQIIFMAVMLGLAAASIAQKIPQMRNALSVLDGTFSRITTGLVRVIPFVVFCSMAKMATSVNLSNLKDVLNWVPVVYFGDVLMILVYLIILAVLGNVNPIRFIRTYFPAMISAFTRASSSAALPVSFRQIQKLGVSKKLYSFSLPLGATINMDGSCITLMITSMFFASIFGISVSGALLTSLFITIMVLSVGSPGVPGGDIICIALLLPMIGIPTEAVSIVMGLYPVIDMMQTCANVTGDAVVTYVVARFEGLVGKK